MTRVKSDFTGLITTSTFTLDVDIRSAPKSKPKTEGHGSAFSHGVHFPPHRYHYDINLAYYNGVILPTHQLFLTSSQRGLATEGCYQNSIL